MRVAVCDDEKSSLELAGELLEELCGELFGGAAIDLYTDNLKMLKAHEREQYDIVVMDIQMQPVDGFQAAQRLAQSERPCRLIFLSSKEELVFQSFRYEPVYFVRKGSRERERSELKRALKRIQEKLLKQMVICVLDGEGMRTKLPVPDIAYIESSHNDLRYVTVSGSAYRLRRTMEEEERNLERYGFLRIHRAFLVNLAQIASIKPNASQVKLKSGELLNVGKNYRKALGEKFGAEGEA